MISKANISDIPALNLLVNSAYRGESSKKGWTTEEHLLDGIRTDEESLEELLTNPNATILKYSENDKILGCVYLEKQADKLYLGMLTVSPELQGAGIGKKLIKAAEQLAREEDLEKVSMTVISVRKELIEFYERRGYQSTGERKPFPMDNPKFGLPKQVLEFIVMEKKIA
ncbi:GCN5-related N-acetyltransferase [Emticicia oligotrophica DSM 17448]|uniref:GCN5-related N-acetyltransferase n=1 Tax=Emticicia oligotrophica (strain DSM 17448 / CIP 109782 / MTCC 6937 / GPTSA100-15) TaxID=929562 RepID=A0ABN4AE08_EMTOG|nr:GNAT family N-acetyltransferase [Emticicia oligotrophica]AFK01784.1 GCN5-related N-acetyltransferase [Emticicia oligotrophica DSM 17448]